MSRRDLSLTIALCASLLAHGVLALLTFEGARRQLGDIRLPGHPRQISDTIAIAAPLAGVRLGGLTEDGLSPNASPGHDGLRAKEAPGDQALLSRDPQGPGRVGDLPSLSLVPQTDGPAIDATPAAVVRVRPVAVLPAATESAQPFGAGPAAAEVVALKPRRAVAPASPASPASPTPAAAPQDAQARSSKPAADPAVMSPSESDAFSMLGGIEFRDGRMESRLGRSFKSVRPRLSLAAQLDLMSITNPRLVLKVAIDPAGNVTAVDVLKSTGSTSIDQPVKLAMYQWWFEPAKGAGDKAAGETFVFPISWH